MWFCVDTQKPNEGDYGWVILKAMYDITFKSSNPFNKTTLKNSLQLENLENFVCFIFFFLLLHVVSSFRIFLVNCFDNKKDELFSL